MTWSMKEELGKVGKFYSGDKLISYLSKHARINTNDSQYPSRLSRWEK